MSSNLDNVIAEINKKYKTDIIKMGNEIEVYKKIPFTSMRANYITYNGIPQGKATEFLGPEGGGKTTSALDIVANAQKFAMVEYNEEVEKLEELLEKTKAQTKQKEIEERLDYLESRGPRKVVYVDAEHTLDEEWARKLGVDVDAMYLLKPDDQTAEQVLQMMLDLLKSGDVLLMVLDSIPMLVPKDLYEKSMEDKSYCGVSGAMAVFSAKVSPILARHGTALIMINQMREDISNPYNIYKTPGGRALKHLYSLRIMFRKGTLIGEDNEELKQSAESPSGNQVDMTLVKTKVCKADRKVGFYTLRYDIGIDNIADLVSLAIKYDIILQTGKWYAVVDEYGTVIEDPDGKPLKFDGKAKLLAYLREDEVIIDEISQRVSGLIIGGQ